MKRISIFCILSVLLLASCATTKVNNLEDGITEKEDNSIAHARIKGKWKLTEFLLDGKQIDIVADTEPNFIGIVFESKNKNNYPFYGFSGVNQFGNGTATIHKNGKFEISEFSTTLRTGPDEHMAFEELFKTNLFNSDSITVEKNSTILTLYGSENKSVLVFNKIK